MHRMNPDDSPPPPEPGSHTIYVGTSNIQLTLLKNDHLPGQVPSHAGTIRINASVDEIDEAFVYSNGQYILSEGAKGKAPEAVITDVLQARRVSNW